MLLSTLCMNTNNKCGVCVNIIVYTIQTWYGNMSYRIYFLWWMFLNVISVLWIPYLLYTAFVKEGWTWYIFIVVKGMTSGTAVFSALLKVLVFPKKLRSGVHPLSPLCTPIFGLVVLILRLFGFMYSICWYIPFVHLHEENLQIIDGDEEEDEEMNIAKEYEYQCTFIKSKSKHSNNQAPPVPQARLDEKWSPENELRNISNVTHYKKNMERSTTPAESSGSSGKKKRQSPRRLKKKEPTPAEKMVRMTSNYYYIS